MQAIKPRIKQPLRHRLYAWAGRQVYALRELLEEINNWLDKKAGEYWIEDY